MARYIKKTEVKTPSIEHIVETHNHNIDIKDLANSVAQMIIPHLQTAASYRQGLEQVDTFDDSKTLESLAKGMIVHNKDNCSNFEALGNVSKTKKEPTETDNAINWLSNVDD